MPYNGAGLFVRVYSWVTDQVNGIFVDAERTDTDTDDIAAGLSNCMTRDGQSPATAPIPMGGQRLTGLGNGSATDDAVSFGQVFNSPTFTTPSAADSPLPSDNSTLLATTEFVKQQAFSSALPSQTGNAGKYLTTDGTTASFGSIDSRGLTFLDKGNSGTTPQVLNYGQAESQKITVTGAFILTTAGWLANRWCGVYLNLVNPGTNVTFSGFTWIKTDGTFTTNFADLGLTLPVSGSAKLVVWNEDGGGTVFGRVIR